jgi:hypothetical protein
MTSPTQTNELEYDSYRQLGDNEADALVEALLGEHPSRVIKELNQFDRHRYNAFLGLADRILEAPELLLIPDSDVRFRLESLRKAQNAELVEKFERFFSPMVLPGWLEVDEAKLACGSHVWANNTIAVMASLYAASLPACYLIRNGIPALYQTRKLADRNYLTQRLYETGLMVDAVMDAKGLEIIRDADGKVYLWGKGYLTAKKVRFLHASMRYMLQHKGRFEGDPKSNKPSSFQTLSEVHQNLSGLWEVDRLGVPVNQEDLAYTLLTFAYVIPKSLEHWGCELTLEEKEAFLHLWKIVGFTMGIMRELLTDDWEEADRMYYAIQRTQAGASEDGYALTEAIVDFVETYVPDHFGSARRIAILMIADQLGDNAPLLFDPKEHEIVKARRSVGGAIYLIGRFVIRFYFRVRNGIFSQVPLVSSYVGRSLHRVGEELIGSMHERYQRKPFAVPGTYLEWRKKMGADNPHFLKALQQWRHGVFSSAALGVAGIITTNLLAFFAFVVGIVAVARDERSWDTAFWALIFLAIAAFMLFLHETNRILPSLLDKRPKIKDFVKGI